MPIDIAPTLGDKAKSPASSTRVARCAPSSCTCRAPTSRARRHGYGRAGASCATCELYTTGPLATTGNCRLVPWIRRSSIRPVRSSRPIRAISILRTSSSWRFEWEAQRRASTLGGLGIGAVATQPTSRSSSRSTHNGCPSYPTATTDLLAASSSLRQGAIAVEGDDLCATKNRNVRSKRWRALERAHRSAW